MEIQEADIFSKAEQERKNWQFPYVMDLILLLSALVFSH